MEKKNMLKEALREINGPLGQLMQNLAGNDGESWLAEFKLFLRQEPSWVDKKADPEKFYFINRVFLPETFNKFSARYSYIIGLKDKAKPQISFIDDTFRLFLLLKTEEAQAKKSLRRYELLLESMHDEDIINKLGFTDPENVFATLQDIWVLLCLQPNGQNGHLLTNGLHNIFYVKDDESTKVKVQVSFKNLGWFLEAEVIDDQTVSYKNSQFFTSSPYILSPPNYIKI